MRLNQLEQRAVAEHDQRLAAKAAAMAPQEVAQALRRHLSRMAARGASALPSVIIERAAELLEGMSSDSGG